MTGIDGEEPRNASFSEGTTVEEQPAKDDEPDERERVEPRVRWQDYSQLEDRRDG